jgi:hypothetical protein
MLPGVVPIAEENERREARLKEFKSPPPTLSVGFFSFADGGGWKTKEKKRKREKRNTRE